MFAQAKPLAVSDSQRRELTVLANGRNTPQKIALRARIILLSGEGSSVRSTAERLGTCRATVTLWRERFADFGIQGLMHETKPTGRPRLLCDKSIDELVAATINTTRPDGQPWSVRSFAKAHGLHREMVYRIWKQHDINPHKLEAAEGHDISPVDDDVDRISEPCEIPPCIEPDSSANSAQSSACGSSNVDLSLTEPVEHLADKTTLSRIPPPVQPCVDRFLDSIVAFLNNNTTNRNRESLYEAFEALVCSLEDCNEDSTTDQQLAVANPTPDVSDSGAQRFESYVSRLCKTMGHANRYKPLRAYITGILLPGERKSIEPMAAKIDPYRVQARHNSMHHFVADASWDEQRLIREARGYALEGFEQHGGIHAWVVDDTGMPKKGTHSVGVARQYCGVLGKTENCQVAVSVSLANEVLSIPVAYRLYLPEVWASDRLRLDRAGVPEDVEFQTKWQIALKQIKQLLADGVPVAPVVADAGYGDITEFRDDLTALKLRYSVGIKPGTSVWPEGEGPLPPPPYKGRGRPAKLVRRTKEHKPMAAGDLALSLAADAWQNVEWREGTLGKMTSRFAALRVRPAHEDDQRTEPRAVEWLLIEWPEHEPAPTKYWLCTLDENTALADLVRTTKVRWRIERDYEELKDELGLDHFEGRSWRGFHHHGALCIAAYAFLCAERSRLSPPEPVAVFNAVPVPEGWCPRGSPRAARAT